ncbi:unnamed protein product [Tilletia controversa]|nr:unnamed protein product [Tilletia controversa]
MQDEEATDEEDEQELEADTQSHTASSVEDDAKSPSHAQDPGHLSSPRNGQAPPQHLSPSHDQEPDQFDNYDPIIDNSPPSSGQASQEFERMDMSVDDDSDEAEEDGSEDGHGSDSEEDDDEHQHQDQADDRAPADFGAQSRNAQQLFDELVENYRPGPRPQRPPNPRFSAEQVIGRLTPSQTATLRHIRACIRTKATDEQYRAFARNTELANPDIKILGKDEANKLVKRVNFLHERKWDMCPESCTAFVGPYADLQHCTAIRNGRRCRAARYDSKGKPRKQFSTLSILPRIRARFAAGSGHTYLQHFAQLADQEWGTEGQRFFDWSSGATHRKLVADGLFSDARHDAFLLSTDGAQMVEKRKSSGWVVLLSSFNTPGWTRYKHDETFVSTIIPGPQNPIDVDSFLWTILQEIARAAVGYWMWDGSRNEWFLWRGWIVAAAADQQESGKINRMTGPSGFAGCKTCRILANYAKEKDNVGYFPLKTVQGDRERTRLRPGSYDPRDLPMRNDETFEEDLAELDGCRNQAERRETRRLTGLGGLPLLAFSPAFTSPTFFPPDIFHLFGSNVPGLIWTTLTTKSDPEDPFSLSQEQQDLFADTIKSVGKDLPSSISSAPTRSPNITLGSHFKMFEWFLVMYTYLPPFLVAIDAPGPVIQMISHLSAGVRLAISRESLTMEQLQEMQDHFILFAQLWEDQYIRAQPQLLHRATISVHHLLHIWQFVYCHGSVRVTSQARCEREIRLIKPLLRSFKSPFVGVMNAARQREHLRILDVVLDPPEEVEPFEPSRTHTTRITSRHRPLSDEYADQELACLQAHADRGHLPNPLPEYVRRGKLTVARSPFISFTVRGTRIESASARSASQFGAFGEDDDGGRPIVYGEALHFLCLFPEDAQDDMVIDVARSYVLFRRLDNVERVGHVIRGNWSARLGIMHVGSIFECVGIMELGGYIYILTPPSIPEP